MRHSLGLPVALTFMVSLYPQGTESAKLAVKGNCRTARVSLAHYSGSLNGLTVRISARARPSLPRANISDNAIPQASTTIVLNTHIIVSNEGDPTGASMPVLWQVVVVSDGLIRNFTGVSPDNRVPSRWKAFGERRTRTSVRSLMSELLATCDHLHRKSEVAFDERASKRLQESLTIAPFCSARGDNCVNGIGELPIGVVRASAGK